LATSAASLVETFAAAVADESTTTAGRAESSEPVSIVMGMAEAGAGHVP
jgi:hypothetical protein